jgi:hypothetical protein
MELPYIVFMKYGIHASEDIEKIIHRKIVEEQQAGMLFWGYGGTICNPASQIRPFLLGSGVLSENAHLVMARTNSKMLNTPAKSQEYSYNRRDWNSIPKGISVTGSKYAIVCKKLQRCNFELDLSQYCVPIGPSAGKPLSCYIMGRVDKGCGIKSADANHHNSKIMNITLIAEIIEPYAVFLR